MGSQRIKKAGEPGKGKSRGGIRGMGDAYSHSHLWVSGNKKKRDGRSVGLRTDCSLYRK